MKRTETAQTTSVAKNRVVVRRVRTVDFLLISYCLCISFKSLFLHTRWALINQHKFLACCRGKQTAYYNSSSFALATEPEKPYEEDILAELLADERRHHEELEQLEAEMRHLKELEEKHAAQQRESSSTKIKMQPKVMPGNKSPSGIKTKSLDQIEQDLRNKEAQMNEAKRKVNEDAEKESKKRDAEKIALQREAKFQAEMEKLTDEKKRKALLQEKQRDARIVKRILRLSEKEKHYDVLGLRWKWGVIRLGPFVFGKTTVADVKRAYRNAARWVHPDKNKDGRAGEAFDALDKSAAILMDDRLKREYDSKMTKKRRDAIQQAMKNVVQTWIKLLNLANLLRKILGPFALPIIIILVLLI